MNSEEMSELYRLYVLSLENELEKLRKIAKKAREKGLDPSSKVECDIAKDLAGLVEGLVGPPGVAESIRSLSEKLPREEMAFKIAEEIVYGKFGHMEPKEAAEQAVRTALAILTEGITAAPLQGVAKVEIKENFDHTKYLAIYFAGPIRSAGGTEQALTLVVGDFVRKLLGLDRYKPTEEEIARFIEEVRLFERSVARFQYHVSDEQLREALQRIPVEVTGTESDPIEVSSYRNLPRIETNRLRGGALRVVNDGIIGRAAKVWAIVEKLGIEGWDWLKTMGKTKKEKSAGFLDDVIAGRPIFAFPSKMGGFRLRYGRARNTGIAAVGIHPATMLVLQGFLAAGTQLRLELPGKGGIVLPVDSIEPPVVRLRDGSVVRVTLENYFEVKDLIDKVLFLGDILISYSDFLYNNKPLAVAGYCEEWWSEELKEVISREFDGSVEAAAEKADINYKRLRSFIENPFSNKPTVKEALSISLKLNVPLHPRFTYFWEILPLWVFKHLRRWVLEAEKSLAGDLIVRICGLNDGLVKKALERMCVPHRLVDGKIVVEGDDASILAFCVAWHLSEIDIPKEGFVLDVIRELTGVTIRRKASTLVGARMGRPEKAKRREMKPLVHVLFPVGFSGGAQRDLVVAAKKGQVWVEIVRKHCPKCGESFFFYSKCPNCGVELKLEKICPICGRTFNADLCPTCNVQTRSYVRQIVNVRALLEAACKRLNAPFPELVKGVKGLTNESKMPEIIEKGILRAKYDLSVFKDGTVRFDATNAPLTHFKPSEIGVGVKRLRELGYTHDTNGEPLTRADQVCELKLQDVVIPLSCAQYFVRVANFVDELLEKVYGLPRYYNVRKVEDLIGHLVIGLAPHTSVGILGRIIGFTPLNLCYAHPMWHSAKRRDCDGDEDALMLALDVLLNFSREYLPAQIGGIMDAPLLINPFVNPREVQRQAQLMDVGKNYPLEFYEKTIEGVQPKEVSELIDLVADRLGTPAQFEGFGYTVPVSNINLGNRESSYKRFKRMIDKLNSQLELAEKIRAVNARTVARKVLTTHFLRDIAGNLRAFSTQGFRCKSCNKRFRRPPLKGKCPECGGPITLTVYRGGIEKYLEAAKYLIKKYDLPNYFAQRIALIENEINYLFEGKRPKQVSLTDFA